MHGPGLRMDKDHEEQRMKIKAHGQGPVTSDTAKHDEGWQQEWNHEQEESDTTIKNIIIQSLKKEKKLVLNTA